MTKKSTQLFRHWIIDGRIILWFNIGPNSFPNGYSSCGMAGRSTSLWFCVSLWSARKSKYIRFQRTIFELHLRGFLLVVVVLLVAQVRDQLTQAMRNSDPRVRIVLVHRVKATGCNFQYGSNLGAPSNPTFWFRKTFVSWQNVLMTCHWFCELWELFNVLCHEALSDVNSCQESCINTNFNHTILLWQPFHSFLVLLQ